MNTTAVAPRLDLINGRPVTPSTNVADVFGKQHKDVMRSIRALEVPEEFARRNFAPGSYLDPNGQARPMCNLTRDGFTLLAMGFTGKAAMQFKLAYIDAFNRMEQELLNRSGGGNRRVDLHHHRGPVSESGLDIRYTLDLTKVILRPTKKSLELLQRLTGVDVGDLVAEMVPPPVKPAHQLLADYLHLMTLPAPGQMLRLTHVVASFNRWRMGQGTGKPLDGRGMAAALREMGYILEKKGMIMVKDIRLVEEVTA
jgi:Rha family phage regulatory protein